MKSDLCGWGYGSITPSRETLEKINAYQSQQSNVMEYSKVKQPKFMFVDFVKI